MSIINYQLLKFLVQRPIAVIMSFLGAIILGIIVLRSIPISLLPEIPIPEITVQIEASNQSAREIENTITLPIRNQLLQVNGLKDIQSESRNGQGLVKMTFDYGTNTDLTFIEVNEKIDQVMGVLPRSVTRPRVIKANAGDIPVLYLAIVPKQYDEAQMLEVSDFARSVIKRRLEQLDPIAFADLTGYSEPIISIEPNPQMMQMLRWSEQDIQRVLQENDLDLGNVLIKDGQYQYPIRFTSSLTNIQDLKEVFINVQGRVLQLKEIAEISMIAAPKRGMTLMNENPAVFMTIRKKADAQLFDLKKEVDTTLSQFAIEYPELEIVPFNNQSEVLEVSIDNLSTSLLYGAGFAFIIMFLFFREWKAPILIGLAIPVSLIVALFGFYLSGMSINVISLSGLILGVGLMIDNSIIVIDNVRQYRHLGHSVLEACVLGANEVIRPLISSALTTCSVFLPLIFLSGLAGALFFDQALSITIALGASLIVAYLLLPTLLHLIMKGEANTSKTPINNNLFTRSVDVVLDYSWLFALLFIGIIGSSLFWFGKLEQQAFPDLSKRAIEVFVDWGEPIHLEENQQRVLDIQQGISSQAINHFTFLGEDQFTLGEQAQEINEARWITYLSDGSDIETVSAQLNERIRNQHPRAQTSIVPLQNLFDQLFSRGGANVRADVYSLTNQSIPSAQQLLPILNSLESEKYGVSRPPQQDQLIIEIDRKGLMSYKIDYTQVVSKLKTLFNEYQIGELKTSQQFIPIKVFGNQSDLYNSLQTVMINNREGAAVPLSSFINIKPASSYKTIFADRTGEILPITLEVDDQSSLDKVTAIIKKDQTLGVRYSGSFFDNQELLKQLMYILLISLMLLYLILAAQFESLVKPLIVMMSVPVGITGALLALMIMKESINLISIIGIIVMSGIVVNDAILKVDMINRNVKKLGLREAIHMAGIRRLRPIIMTSLTTILALIPIILASGLGAELQRPLAISIIGGLVFGTIASLYWIPLLYKAFSKKEN